MSTETKIVAGSVKTKVMGIANKVLPDEAKAAIHRQMAKPQSQQRLTAWDRPVGVGVDLRDTNAGSSSVAA